VGGQQRRPVERDPGAPELARVPLPDRAGVGHASCASTIGRTSVISRSNVSSSYGVGISRITVRKPTAAAATILAATCSGVARQDAERLLLARAADHDRDVPTNRARVVAQVAEAVVVLRSAGHAATVEQGPNCSNRLVQPADSLARTGTELDPVRVVFERE